MTGHMQIGKARREDASESYIVWCKRDDGDRIVTVVDSLPAARRRCRGLYAGYVTGALSWRVVYSVGQVY